jgi:hypothetical protein
MNEPHENLDHDPFADDAQRRRPRLRRTVVRQARGGCTRPATRLVRASRSARPCPLADRGPLR